MSHGPPGRVASNLGSSGVRSFVAPHPVGASVRLGRSTRNRFCGRRVRRRCSTLQNDQGT